MSATINHNIDFFRPAYPSFENRTKKRIVTSSMNSFLNVEIPLFDTHHIRASIGNSLLLNEYKEYVVLINKFQKYCAVLNEYNFDKLKNEFIEVSSSIFKLNPNKIGFSLTSEQSLFFTVFIGDFEFNLNYFFKDSVDELDNETIVVVKNAEGNKTSFGGSFNDVIFNMKNILELEEMKTTAVDECVFFDSILS